jgi:hypothetical protein
MSVKLMALVWEYQFTRPEQSVMLALADHAQDDGSNVYPSVARIAWKTDYSERQVQRIMRDLEAKDILVAVKNIGGGRGHATEYCIHIEKGVKKSPFVKKGDMVAAKGDIPDDKGDIPSVKGDAIVSPQPSLEPSNESSKNRESDTAASGGARLARPSPTPPAVFDFPRMERDPAEISAVLRAEWRKVRPRSR